MFLFDFLHEPEAPLQEAVGLFAFAGILTGSLTHKMRTGSWLGYRLMAKWCVLGGFFGAAMHGAYVLGLRNHRNWAAFNEKTRLFEEECLARRRRMAELLDIIEQQKQQ